MPVASGMLWSSSWDFQGMMLLCVQQGGRVAARSQEVIHQIPDLQMLYFLSFYHYFFLDDQVIDFGMGVLKKGFWKAQRNHSLKSTLHDLR